MATKKKTTDVSHVGFKIGVTMATIAGLAGAYFLYGSKDATKNRKKIQSWMLKAKAEVLEKIEKAKNINAEKFQEIIDGVMAKYAKMSNVGLEESQKLGKELKKHWKEIEKEIFPKKK